MKTGYAFLALALCAISSLQAQMAPHNDRQVIPGKRAGLISLGEELTAVERDFGGAKIRDMVSGEVLAVWPADKHGGTIEAFFKRTGEQPLKVHRIRVTSDKYFTPGGVYVGSGLSRINDIYPKATAVPIGTLGNTLYDVVAAGVAFEVSPNSAASPAHCTAIFVHEAGKPIFATGGKLDLW